MSLEYQKMLAPSETYLSTSGNCQETFHFFQFSVPQISLILQVIDLKITYMVDTIEFQRNLKYFWKIYSQL